MSDTTKLGWNCDDCGDCHCHEDFEAGLEQRITDLVKLLSKAANLMEHEIVPRYEELYSAAFNGADPDNTVVKELIGEWLIDFKFHAKPR